MNATPVQDAHHNPAKEASPMDESVLKEQSTRFAELLEALLGQTVQSLDRAGESGQSARAPNFGLSFTYFCLGLTDGV
eukprot:g21943.t1